MAIVPGGAGARRRLVVRQRLRERRRDLGLTQKQVVSRLARLGMLTTNKALSSLEHGTGLDVAKLPELARALECTITYLLGLTSDPSRWEPDPRPAPARPTSAVTPVRQEPRAPVREQGVREQAERERLAREQVVREQAERDRLAREQAVREQAVREQGVRQQAEQERLAREQAVREQAERDRLAREQAERERLAREQVVREQAERERTLREESERDSSADERSSTREPIREPSSV